MSPASLGDAVQALAPHLVAVALCGARLLPVAFLCPMLGGTSAPTTVRLGVTLSLAVALHGAGGVAPVAPVTDAWAFSGLAVRELALGLAMGLVASLPFDAARIGGRLVDLFRGSSAEAALPVAGTREAASGDALYQLLVAMVAAGGAFPIVVGSLWRSFGVVRLGAYVPSEAGALQIASLVGTAMATGLAVGAPVAGAVMAVDCFLGLASRAAPQFPLTELGAPLRIVGGGAVLWLSVGLVSDRLLAGVLASEGTLRALLETGP